MNTVIAISATLLFGSLDQRVVVEEQENSPVTLEKKLHGEWKGGPCMGDWTFDKDGGFALKNYSPGGNNFTGAWKVRWDALPPTLVLTFKTSDAPNHFKVGDTWKVKLIQVDDKTIGYARLEDATRVIFCRRKK